MKNLKITIFALLVVLFCLCSCSDDVNEPVSYTLTISSTEGGTVTTEKSTYIPEEEVTVTATADDGYIFAGWYEAEEMVSSESIYSFRMPAHDVSLQAQFEANTVSIAEAVDLGLSVKWAAWNIGAATPEEYGGLYGWADPTGEKQTTDFNDYPSDTPPENICGTEYDIAYVQWGENWRMPTQEEVQELVDNCTWEWTELNGINGRRATGPNGNSIFFPAGASRTGDKISNQVRQRGCYWTGTLYPSDSDFAYYLYFYSKEQFGNRNTRRYIGHSVRAVTE